MKPWRSITIGFVQDIEGMVEMANLKCFLLLSVIILMFSPGCTDVKHNAVGWFDDYNEALVGEVSSNLMTGTSTITVKSPRTGLICTGDARVTENPNPWSLNCAGQKGIADLSCSDGRRVSLNYSLTSCTTGFGRGKDQDGNTLTVEFGMSKAQSQAAISRAGNKVAGKPDLPEVYNPGKTRSEKGFATGTGFFISSNGVIATNHHVVEGASDIEVVDTFTGRTSRARVLRGDPNNDIALIKIDSGNTPFLSLSRDAPPRKGDEVIALGYPLISVQGQEQKATFGRVNALSGGNGDERFMQIDVPIQPGNSGGPLLNLRGEVVGITTQTVSALFLLIEQGVIPQNINYAVKISRASSLIDQITGGSVSQQYASSPPRFGSVADVVAASERAVVLIIAK